MRPVGGDQVAGVGPIAVPTARGRTFLHTIRDGVKGYAFCLFSGRMTSRPRVATSVASTPTIRMAPDLCLLLVLGPHDLTAQGRHKRGQHADDQDGA